MAEIETQATGTAAEAASRNIRTGRFGLVTSKRIQTEVGTG